MTIPTRLSSTIAASFAALCIVSTAFGIEDTPENRIREAERYLKAIPPEEMFLDMTEEMAKNMPESERELFKAVMTKHLDVPALTKTMKNSMVKHFTAEELKALADFYGSEVGKSAMKKFGVYLADVMPTIQEEVMKAQDKAIRE
ncbi:DUF2059 domain-containing protein [Luteolibacter pohnpeiensis]|uniref:DUF2059 domain-containing protein n=1 Tax=Luteolibacter pohnpeiensis TaxID=454153 RepID=A0A934VWM6_9BACT|nr:DUF2059 domain-containing protein [Luteolibacter pohnpeiensis]MBK1882664.1 DUF2059 domain-containing protein [Luteolibacter pohnpeiensis]